MVDMLEYLLPPPQSILTYETWSRPISGSRFMEGELQYRRDGVIDVSNHERRYRFSKFFRKADGSRDSSTSWIVSLMTNPPAVLLADSALPGWWPLRTFDSTEAWYHSEVQVLPGYGTWDWQRFLPAEEVAFESNDHLLLRRLVSFPATNSYDHTARLQSGRGIVFLSGYRKVLHGYSSDTLILRTLTGRGDVLGPQAFELEPAWPNPFASSTHIAVRLDRPASLRVTVYDMLGREIALLADGRFDAGRHIFHFNAAALRPGMYLVRATTGGSTGCRRMLLRR